MAKAKIRIQYGRVWLEVDADGVKDVIQTLSEYGEVFNVSQCGKCQSDALLYDHHQNNQGHHFYAIKCAACGCQLDLGQHQQGDTLFIKRKDAEGNYDTEHGGWYHWKEREKPQRATQQQSQQQPSEDPTF